MEAEIEELENQELNIWLRRHSATEPYDHSLLFTEVELQVNSPLATEHDRSDLAVLNKRRTLRMEIRDLFYQSPRNGSMQLPVPAESLQVMHVYQR